MKTWRIWKQEVHQKESFYRLLASFCVMLLLPVLILLANFVNAKSLLQKENINYQNAVLLQAQMTVDERLQSLQLYAIDLSNDQLLNTTLRAKDMTAKEASYQLWKTSEHLRNFTATTGSSCYTMVYSVKHDCLISRNYVDYQVSNGLTRLSGNELNEILLQNLQQNQFYCQIELLKDSEGKQQLILFHSVPLWSTGAQAYGTICLVIEEEALFSSIDKMEELQPGIICLLDEKGRAAAWSGSDKLLGYLDTALASDEPIQNLDGTKYTVSKAESSLKGWSYISLQPEHVMMDKLRSSGNISLVMLVLLLVLGGWCIWFLTNQNYRPLKHLLSELRKNSVILQSRDKQQIGEFGLIEKSIYELQYSMKEVQEALRNEIPRIQESALLQLLKNDVSDYDSFRKMLERVGILFPYQNYRVVFFRQMQHTDAKLEEQAMWHVILREQISLRVPNSMAYASVTLTHDSLALILNNGNDEFDAQSHSIIDELYRVMRDEYDELLWVCVSRIALEMQEVPTQFFAVAQAQPPQQIGGVRYLDVQKNVWFMNHALNTISAQLRNDIASGDAQSAIQLLRHSFADNLRERQTELYEVHAYALGVLNLIAGAYRIENPEVLQIDGKSPMQLIFQSESVDNIEEILQDVITQLCSYILENKKSPAAQLIVQILSYMQQNYSNADLTLTSVADHFYITSNYLSIFFRDNVGDTFLNYLIHLRLEKAKALMLETNHTITEIAEMVGYTSNNSFTRVFKKMEHITPTKYRESNRH